MSDLDAILARSRHPGRFVERRRFTLSREQALARHRSSTLRHPAWYVLELIQAAVFAGADYIAVEASARALRLAWVGGRPIAEREVASLFDHLASDPTDPERRHLAHLALGLNDLLRHGPRRVRLETGDGRGAVRMDLRRRGEIQVGPVDAAIDGTCVVARHRDDWLRRLGGEPWCEERALVEERCQYAPVPILLDGRAPFGYRGDTPIEIFGALHQRPFAQGGRRGVVAIPERGQRHAGFRVVVGGVWVATLPLRGLATGPVIGVVCDDALRRTSDGSSIVRDERYHALLSALHEEATALMREVEGPGYAPPPLGPPAIVTRVSTAPVVPLPRRFRSLPPRGPWLASDVAARGAGPLPWCAPEDVGRLVGPADPARVPEPVLVLRPAERRALERHLPHVELWQLRDATDARFAARRHPPPLERAFEHAGGRARVRLHLRGPLPAWGPGVPFAVTRDGRTELLGGIDGARVLPTGARGPRPPATDLAAPLALPRVSLLLEGLGAPDDALLGRVRAEAAQLALDAGDEAPVDLVAALLATFVPSFAGDPPRVEALPPPGAPEALAERPLVHGGPTLRDLLALLGTDAVLPLASLDHLSALAPVEARFGWGHLGHPALDGRPVWAVGRIGRRWSWLERPELLTAPALEQIVQVSANFAPPRREGWSVASRPHPCVAALRRDDVAGEDWARGYELLTMRLRRAGFDDGWPAPLTPVGPDRARAMGRLALLALAARDRPGDLLLRPTSGDAYRSLAQVGADPAARAVARGGVATREPDTFALTLDELRAVRPVADLRPRDLRALTLADPDDGGWLLRAPLHGPGLRAVLGLEHPYAGGGSLLVRSAAGLSALGPVGAVPGRHALLEPFDARAPRGTDARLLTIELARLTPRLAAALSDGRLDPGRAETARLHALATALVAWRSGRLVGPAWELARQASIRDPLGGHWGSLADWLAAPADERPPLPDAVAPLAGPLDEPALAGPVHARVAEILADARLAVRLSWIHDGRGAPVRVAEERSSPTRVVLLLDRSHPAVARAAVEPGREREIVLLECARRLAAWGRARGIELDLPTMQRLLLARRLEEPVAPGGAALAAPGAGAPPLPAAPRARERG